MHKCERSLHALHIWMVYDVNSFCCFYCRSCVCASYVQMLYIFLLLRNSKCCFLLRFGEPLDVLLLLLQCVSLKRIYFWNSVQNDDDDGEKKTQQYEKWRRKIWAHPKMLRRCCARARLIFISEIYVYSMYLSVCFGVGFFWSCLFISLCFCHRVCCSKINYPFFSLPLALSHCSLFLLRWIAHKMIFSEFSWATAHNMNCEYVRVQHIEPFTSSMWLNWLEYSYLFQDTHFTHKLFKQRTWGLRWPYLCSIEFHRILA